MSERFYGNLDADKLDQWIESAEGGSSLKGSELSRRAVSIMADGGKRMMQTVVDYKELMMTYSCAIKEVRTKFEVLSTEFAVRYQRNPISSMSSRLKKTSGIAEKLSKKGLPFTVENVEENIHDVAGVRVICGYIDDIYMIADAFLSQDDITLLEKKDYIAHPKENGYRSLHLIVEVPVFFSTYKKSVKAEVQIRTMAMDFWASLEHQLRYKSDVKGCKEVEERLKTCAEVISKTDEEMLQIRRRIESLNKDQDDEEILLEKLSKLDIRIE